MRFPDELFVGVSATIDDPPDTAHLEIGDYVELPSAARLNELGKVHTLTLAGWHVLTHPRTDPRYALMADPPPDHAAVGHFERSRWTDEAWEQLDRITRATDVMAVVFDTPASFKRSEDHAIRLENFVAHGARPGLSIGWEPARGSWPAKDMLELCDRIGAVPVVDPTESPIPEGEYVYLRFTGGKSGRKVLKDDDLKSVALEARDRLGWVVFSNATALEDAERFRAML